MASFWGLCPALCGLLHGNGGNGPGYLGKCGSDAGAIPAKSRRAGVALAEGFCALFDFGNQREEDSALDWLSCRRVLRYRHFWSNSASPLPVLLSVMMNIYYKNNTVRYYFYNLYVFFRCWFIYFRQLL